MFILKTKTQITIIILYSSTSNRHNVFMYDIIHTVTEGGGGGVSVIPYPYLFQDLTLILYFFRHLSLIPYFLPHFSLIPYFFASFIPYPLFFTSFIPYPLFLPHLSLIPYIFPHLSLIRYIFGIYPLSLKAAGPHHLKKSCPKLHPFGPNNKRAHGIF